MIWILSSILFVLVCLALIGISVYVGWQLTHPKRKPVDASPDEYGLHMENITFPSRSRDVQLDGWFLKSPFAPTDAIPMTVIMSHGYAGTRLEKGLPALALAKSIVEAGYHVLMFDFRNSGKSEGEITTVGFLEKQDVLGAIDWVQERQPSKISLIGFSMGGSTSILAAAEERAVLGVITDSAFSQLSPYLKDNLPVWSNLPRFPFTPLILLILPRLIGINPHRVDALAAVDLIYPRPILFIHSRDDEAIPWSNSEGMWNRHPDAFELWVTQKAGHVGSYYMQPEAYTKRVLDFLSKFNNHRNSS
ncbi:alpha/beta hydrolase [Paenibacillus sp. Soil724D2]|uniref:alpha/beta hydrolase n=1 Tax=Paenibacillus sp. (strain Soil724D2) TaxID=1736392 RepID=UPI0007145E03|nr:alpha/beta fold hydrolase [Paenibacillus sp. Soil724D2]KRE51902.1 alpha/beta hydrolase [Paenibacillus sp. Soil724D2]